MNSVYIPENLNLNILLNNPKYQTLKKPIHIDKLHYFVHLIYIQKILYKTENFVPLKAKYLKKILNNYRLYRMTLEDLKVIECDNFYIKTQKSYGFRLIPPYSEVKFRKTPLISGCFRTSLKKWKISRLPNTKVHKHLFNFLKQIEINYEEANKEADTEQNPEKLNKIKMSIERFLDKDFYLIKDPYNRIHTNLTNLKSNFRKYLSFNNTKLINIDISNSQPLLILLLFKYSILSNSNNIISNLNPSLLKPHTYTLTDTRRFCLSANTCSDIELYQQLVESGKLYDYLSEKINFPKEQIKKALFKKVFFGKRMSKTFSMLFPNISKFIKKVKKKDYKRLAWMMQRIESKIIISKVCGRIMEEHPDLFISTIHDSIMTVPAGVEIVRQIMIEEFNNLGISPKIRIEGSDDTQIKN
jgi:hypothetical protein